MGGVGIGVQEADGDGLAALADKLARGGKDGRLVQRRHHIARGGDTLIDLKPQVAADDRIGIGHIKVIDIIALLGPHFENVAKAAGGDQPDRRALALDHGVGDQRGAMHDFRHIRMGDVLQRQQFLKPFQRGFGRVVGGGQALVQGDGRVLAVIQDKVGEGSANIEPDPPAGLGNSHALRPFYEILGATKARSPISAAMVLAPVASAESMRSRSPFSTTAWG